MESPSAASQVIVTIIPIVGIVMGSIVIFFYLYYHYKQKMLMIEKGIEAKVSFDFESFSLFSGLLLFSIGIFLSVFFLIKEGFGYSLLSGIIPLSSGLGFIAFYIVRIILNKTDNAK